MSAASGTRKPPEPSDSHAAIDDWMRRVMPDLHPIVTRLDELIRETLAVMKRYKMVGMLGGYVTVTRFFTSRYSPAIRPRSTEIPP